MSRQVLAAAVLLIALGCDRAIEPFDPNERPEQPDLARIFPEGAERAARNESEAGGGEAAPPMARRGAAPVGDDASGQAIRGTISIAPDLRDQLPGGAILFLIARSEGGGPPLAVKRVTEPSFPLEFSIGPEDRMVRSMPFTGPLRLSARLDADGNAMTRLAGDLQGAAPGTYDPGAEGVSIVIDEQLSR